ncbi:MAG: tRNA (adenosine(37)-N6)-dimethylallyltransferase MiaA [Roseibium sp.]|uniref:tRNA (adenosine(37)-N6)-dimethylallyltransferase MiaA n=1 Tax=Roseibium sp. TaxID=1936156 RepID=UPI001B033FF1|nr:tRNA (adenosine(37)-N6)-dimethylallyltransferase MiaA [Roseibium sp.]MBO6893495.1 tRNA (adenosine(37)-N6)-dimethylallyltransferase MiaA [Roseibium sp.]MBO6931756.1 tRNA (adenosine(37)-N6)-dimethylallyltransferase MiaA [Roseibium sp.]
MNDSLEGSRHLSDGRRVILIAGPTASGKSALALEIAQKLGGVIINADSMQLYEDLRIVSARPSIDEEALVPHRLYGILPASTPFSTGAWLRRAVDEIEAVRASGQVPVLVGGTGLYFKALTEGFADLPEIPETVRREARNLADREGVEGLKTRLLELGDTNASRTLQDPQRLARALEVLMATGEPLSIWQENHQSRPYLAPGETTRIVLAPPRAWLHNRIEQRAQLMMGPEGITEVRKLLERGLSTKLPAMRAIGVAEIGTYLSGENDIAETTYRLTVATRQYAKRQETWFRNQMPDWQRLDPSSEIDTAKLLS